MLIGKDIADWVAKGVRFLGVSLLTAFLIALLLMALSAPDPMARDWLCVSGPCFSSSNPDFWNPIIHTLASGTVLTLIFYWALVKLPQDRRRSMIKRTFEAQYIAFKLRCIDIFLVISKSKYPHDQHEKLLDVREFRRFFKEDTGEGQNRWHRVLNALDDYYLGVLARKMEYLTSEFRTFVGVLETDDEELLGLLLRFSEYTNANVTFENDYDDVKSLSRYFWDVFAGYNFFEGGNREQDKVLDAIRRA